MAVTLADVLALPVLAAGRPLVLTGEQRLDRPVRWVHVSELPDIASLLRGGELILTTGVALPDSAAGLTGFLADLGQAGACALVVELGRRFHELPPELVAAGRRHDLPVVALRRPVRFVEVTEEVHGLLLDEQNGLLRRSEQAHREFTSLSVEGAPVQRILDKVTELSGHAVVLDDVSHRAVAYACRAHEESSLLDGWETRSRQVPTVDATATAGPEGWLVTPVGPRGSRWGRLVVPAPTGSVGHLTMLLERAAEGLAINRLIERDRAGLAHQAQRGLLTELVLGRATDEATLRARAESLGLPVARQVFLGVAVQSRWPAGLDPVTAEGRDRGLAELVGEAAADAGLDAVVATLRSGQAVALVAATGGRSLEPVLDRLARAVARGMAGLAGVDGHAMGVGSEVATLTAAAASLVEAGHVAEAGLAMRSSATRAYYRSIDVRLRGLLALLRDDPRLLAFTEAELAPVLRHDTERGSDLLATLRAYVAVGGNKTALARSTGKSRPALYSRLAKLEALLGVPLDDAESAVALHVALLAREVNRSLSSP